MRYVLHTWTQLPFTDRWSNRRKRETGKRVKEEHQMREEEKREMLSYQRSKNSEWKTKECFKPSRKCIFLPNCRFFSIYHFGYIFSKPSMLACLRICFHWVYSHLHLDFKKSIFTSLHTLIRLFEACVYVLNWIFSKCKCNTLKLNCISVMKNNLW